MEEACGGPIKHDKFLFNKSFIETGLIALNAGLFAQLVNTTGTWSK